MDALTKLDEWMDFLKDADQAPLTAEPGSPEHVAHTNEILAGATIVALLGELIAQNPARADFIAAELHSAFEHETVTSLRDGWMVLRAAQRPVRIATNDEATQALNWLNQHQPQAAHDLHARWHDATDPFGATNVVAEVAAKAAQLDAERARS
jgi:uncharacterized UBP type Zn finger protein